MILIISPKYDEAVLPVLQELRRRNTSFSRLNIEDIGKEIFFNINTKNNIFSNSLNIYGERFSTKDVRSVWHWRDSLPNRSEQDANLRAIINRETKSVLNFLYTQLSTAFWMNSRYYEKLAINKLYQLKIAMEVDLKVPNFTVTNNLSNALQIVTQSENDLIMKAIDQASLSGHYGLVMNSITIDKNKLNFLDELNHCPIMLQEKIAKVYELRITIVQSVIFTSLVYVLDKDKRGFDINTIDKDRVIYQPYKLGEKIKSKIMNFMSRIKLVYGTIDMLVDEDNNYYFLEVNPGGQYGWIEHETGLRITEAIADTLIKRPKRDIN